MRAAALALVGLAGCGCEHGIFADGLPIAVDLSSGALIVQYAEPGQGPRAAVLDLLAPVTFVDAAEDATPSRRCTDLTVFQGDVPRAHLDLTVTAMHACPAGLACQFGNDGAQVEVSAVIGADAFSPAALRIDFTQSQIAILPDIAGNAGVRGRMCEAQIPDPFRGGGTLFIGGTEVSFPARRIALGACLSYETRVPALKPEDDVETIADGGADVELVLSTGIGPTILSEDAYERWRAAAGGGPEVTSLPMGRVWMPIGGDDAPGQIVGRIGTVDRIALVGYHEDKRGPCRQVYAHHLLTGRDKGCAEGDDCPCEEGAFCRAPSVVELDQAVDVLIVPDDHPLLQALRTELRPRAAEIDGILGTAALRSTSIDIDAPNNRVLVRCEASGCAVRPELITDEVVEVARECLALAAGLPDVTIPATAWSGNR